MIHVVTYVFVMTAGSTIFAKFWIETTNMSAKDVAKQIERTGMQIPGFRKNPVVLEDSREIHPSRYPVFRGLRGPSCRRCGSTRNRWKCHWYRSSSCGRNYSPNIRANTERASHGDASCIERLLRGRVRQNGLLLAEPYLWPHVTLIYGMAVGRMLR